MKPKTHKINTVQDMIEATNAENLDRFLVDLKGVIVMGHLLNLIHEVKSQGFEWVDDGEHKIDIEIKDI